MEVNDHPVWPLIATRGCVRFGVFLLCASGQLLSAENTWEPISLSIAPRSPTNLVLRSSPVRFSGYRLETSADLFHWQDSSVVFGPGLNALAVSNIDATHLNFRLRADTSLALRALEADATTIQLNWPPIPFAAEYKLYRDGVFVGSTAGRCGYFLDTGLKPTTSYSYVVTAFDSANQALGRSVPKTLSTLSSNRLRTHYTVLAVGFYPDGPDGDLPHVRTFFRHKLDFFRLASVNSAVLQPYKSDIICIRATPPLVTTPPSDVDYAKLATTAYPELDGYSMVDLVEKGDVDLVWITAAPENCGFRENALIGNKDLNQTLSGERWFPYPAKCSRSFFVNFGSADARAYDAYAHCIEGIMSCLCDGNLDNWPRIYPYIVLSKTRTDFTTTFPVNLHLFERFRLADQWNGTGAYASAGNGNCGSSHFPPNSRRDVSGSYDGNYAYYDPLTWQRYIDCAADGWLSFPALSPSTRKLNGYDFGAFNDYREGDLAYGSNFGASPQLHSSFTFATDSYHQWWFFHLPHNPGVTDGKLNNWWPYLFDFNRFNGNYISYRVEGFPAGCPSVAPVNGEIGTELDTAEYWGYWHSCSDFGPFGQVSVVNQASHPQLVCQGQYALEVKVDQDWFQYNGRNDLFYPISRDARWDLSHLREVGVSIKLGLHAESIAGANPVIRLCSNGGNRVEWAPLKSGRYANLFQESAFAGPDGWFNFNAPINGNLNWEVNVVGYIDPALSPAQVLAAKQQLKQKILSEVNYVEISVRSVGSRDTQITYHVDGLQFRVD